MPLELVAVVVPTRKRRRCRSRPAHLSVFLSERLDQAIILILEETVATRTSVIQHQTAGVSRVAQWWRVPMAVVGGYTTDGVVLVLADQQLVASDRRNMLEPMAAR